MGEDRGMMDGQSATEIFRQPEYRIGGKALIRIKKRQPGDHFRIKVIRPVIDGVGDHGQRIQDHTKVFRRGGYSAFRLMKLYQMIDADRNRCGVGGIDDNGHKLRVGGYKHTDMPAFRFGAFRDHRIEKRLNDIRTIVHGLHGNGTVRHRFDDGGIQFVQGLGGMKIADKVIDKLPAGILLIADQLDPIGQEKRIFLCGAETQIGRHQANRFLIGRRTLTA